MFRLAIVSILFVYIAPAFAGQVKFVFDQPIEIAQPTGEGLQDQKQVAAGTEVAFESDKVYWVAARGKVPMLVLPQIPSGNAGPLKVSMPDVAAWPSAVMQQELDSKLSQLVTDLTAFQEALRRKNPADAEKALARMEQVGRLDYLHFLRAALKFVQGDIEAAKENTRMGLQRHPANEEGMKFLKRLEGGK